MHAASGLPEGAGDPLLFEQVFGNVLENAIRFSGESQPIVISASLQDEHVLVRVEDEGPGVPASDLTRIFDKFFRSAGAANRSGTGLGLAIAKGLIEGMGGAIWADNREGPGGLRVNMRLTVMR